MASKETDLPGDSASQDAPDSAGEASAGDKESAAGSAAPEQDGPREAKDAPGSDAEGAPDKDAEGRGGGKDGPPAAPKGSAWGEPLARFEVRWTRLETRLMTWVLIAQLASMLAWVLLSGLSSPVESGNASGLVMRALLGAIALGGGGWWATRKEGLNTRRIAAIVGIVVGAAVAPLWRTAGVAYFDNVKAWLQEGSTLTLMGGLRGVATRLTLWLALLGASLATGAGKHINIDVVFRFVPPRARLKVAVLNYCAAAIVCLGAVWGFFDHIAIESYGANADDTAGAKISAAKDRMGDHFFLLRRQLGLDLRTVPHVAAGDRYDQWMSAKAWNDWVKGSGFDERYSKEEVDLIVIPPDSPPHAPLVMAPDGEATRGVLVHDLSLVFPFGMLMIALRFLLRALLVLSGHIAVDPDAAHKEEIGAHAAPEKGGA